MTTGRATDWQSPASPFAPKHVLFPSVCDVRSPGFGGHSLHFNFLRFIFNLSEKRGTDSLTSFNYLRRTQ